MDPRRHHGLPVTRREPFPLAALLGQIPARSTDTPARSCAANRLGSAADNRKFRRRTTPLGPWLVTADEAGDARDLTLSFRVDGVEWQSGSTADMLFR
ncbi:fumarylacetoacetate hydrolase family protein, partial [Pseudosporangium ferrugineum]|uniref:fumarylacetoacetate hydrolase family protein n=1 Tax=Pseudosporangium ferrugineum TaxID=439699 RepID=UPI001B808757